MVLNQVSPGTYYQDTYWFLEPNSDTYYQNYCEWNPQGLVKERSGVSARKYKRHIEKGEEVFPEEMIFLHEININILISNPFISSGYQEKPGKMRALSGYE